MFQYTAGAQPLICRWEPALTGAELLATPMLTPKLVPNNNLQCEAGHGGSMHGRVAHLMFHVILQEACFCGDEQHLPGEAQFMAQSSKRMAHSFLPSAASVIACCVNHIPAPEPSIQTT